jgi:hypothetical protein
VTDRRKFILGAIGALVFTVAVRADMIPVSNRDFGRRQATCASGRTDLAYANLSSQSHCPTVADPRLWSVQLLPKANASMGQASQIQQPQITTDGAGNLSLCLYALIGLGLCRSAPYVKKLSFGCVPEWFHDGGPFQIGHSFAVSPESLCPAPACCFIQPVCTEQPLISQYSLGTIVSLWRKSQFALSVLASRGPPLSC